MENKLNSEQCVEIANRIIQRFYRLAAGGTQYGVDWPTARVLWPRSCRVYARLKARFHALNPKAHPLAIRR